jgi:hypothetical protein
MSILRNRSTSSSSPSSSLTPPLVFVTTTTVFTFSARFGCLFFRLPVILDGESSEAKDENLLFVSFLKRRGLFLVNQGKTYSTLIFTIGSKKSTFLCLPLSFTSLSSSF